MIINTQPNHDNLLAAACYQYQFLNKSMGSCTYRNGGTDYRLTENNSFLICERSPLTTEGKFEIHFIFDDSISTSYGSSQTLSLRPVCPRYDIPIKQAQSKIDTPLSDIASEIQNAFIKALKLNCTKIEFVEPCYQSQKTLSLLFKEIIRMLVYFDQKKMFEKQSKIYLNWSAIDKKVNIANLMKQYDI